MTDLQAQARATLAARLVGDIVKEATDSAKAAAMEAMQGIGAEKVRVTDEAGTNLGTVSLASGRVSARVTDEAAFAAWVQRNHPDETTVVVRDSFRRKVLDSAVSKAEHGDPTAVGPDGEILPGVEVVHGVRYVSCRPTSEARERMRTLVANSGVLALGVGSKPGEVADGAQD